MTVEDSTQEPQEGATVNEDAAPQAAQETEGQEAPKQDEESNDFDTLPDWAKSQIKSLRNESARYRTANKDLQDSLKSAKSQDDIDAATKDYQDKVTTLELELAKTKHTADLSPELQALVDGNTPDEIKAKADAVRAAFNSHVPQTPPSDVDGGLHPGGSDGAGMSPRELAEAARARTRRR